MPSKTVARLDAQNRPLVAGVFEVAEEVGVLLRKRFEPLLEAGETQPDWGLIQHLAGRLMKSNNRRLIDLDQLLELGRTSDRQLRAERDQLAGKVRAALRAARFLVDETFGKSLGAGVFRWRRLSQLNATSLVLVARELVGSLRSPQLKVSSVLDIGTPEAERVAAALEAASSQLEAHLELLEPTVKRETYSVGRKEQELQETRAMQLAAQDLLAGLYRAAGQNHLAARLRPKQRKGRETGETAPPQEGGAGMATHVSAEAVADAQAEDEN
jgi:hypothetical protein